MRSNKRIEHFRIFGLRNQADNALSWASRLVTAIALLLRLGAPPYIYGRLGDSCAAIQAAMPMT
jgi:hypothetical protein